MSFTSWVFLWFLLIVVGVYYALPRRGQNVWLVAASYVFYGWWDPRFLLLIAVSTVIDFTAGRKIAHSELEAVRRRWLTLSVVANLGILGFFKYCNFFVDSFQAVATTFGWNPGWVTLDIVLPVGISFYTFQTMSYTIDIYRKDVAPAQSLIDFALYVAYFPQLVAGPIERASRLLPALTEERRVPVRNAISGIALILCGFVRKLAVADLLAGQVDAVFSGPEGQSTSALWIGLYSFALLIYCDFAGYSDIARGTSRLLGIELMVNFAQPYGATSITDFWRRWHISLSTWLRDYLYIPLGGNRKGAFRTYINLSVTMLLGGLWHGASWKFVVWGALHGAYLITDRLLTGGIAKRFPTIVRRFFGWLFTLHVVCLAWIFFRADNFSGAWSYVIGMVPGNLKFGNQEMLDAHRLLMAGAICLSVDTAYRMKKRSFARLPAGLQGGLIGIAVVVLLIFADFVQTPFIYFQF